MKSSSNRPASTSTTDQGKSTTSSTDAKISDLDRKWSDRFNRLEALLMANTLDKPQDPVFSTVKVTPAHAPPANVVRPDPFLKPVSQPSQVTDPAVDSPATDSSQPRPAARASSSAQPAPATRETVQRQLTSAFDTSRKDSPSSSGSDSDSLSSDRPPLDIFPEEGELSDDQEANLTDHEHSLSEEQSYWETMRGIRSYMNWDHIPDIDSGATTSEDNPFAGPKVHTPGKVSVNLPTDEWLCRKMPKLNMTLVQGYPTRTSEAGGLLRDQFVRPPKSQQKWYGFHANSKDSDQAVSSWHAGSSRLNSTYLRIARQAGIATSPMSRLVSQENLRKWERSARKSTVICNHAASFNCCLLKIQENMNNQLKAVKVESKGKAAAKVSSAVDELQFLLDFNSSVCQAMAKSMEHLTEFVFVTMANTTLLRRYLAHLKAGVKADTLNTLRTAPLHLDTLFPDSVVKRAEEDITSFDKGQSTSVYKGRRYHPYERQDSRSEKNNRTDQLGRICPVPSVGRTTRANSSTPCVRPRVSSSTNDIQCVTLLKPLLLTGSPTGKTMNTLNVKLNVVHSVYTAPWHSQKNKISPGAAGCYYKKSILKPVKSVSCVTPLSYVNPVLNAPNVVTNLPVGARLQKFWKNWLDLGAGPRVVQILKEGYTLPFRIRPNLSRTPTVISCYGNPHRDLKLLEASHQLMVKNAIELVHKKASLGFFNRLFLVPKPDNKWRPILDLRNLNLFLKTEKFKMETPETIRTSLQKGEWVTSIDFKDAYFHIPIKEQSR